MGKTNDDGYKYSFTVVLVFGILGNSLVILSMLRQKKNVLKNNYYFVVLHLAICDLAALIFQIFYSVDVIWLEEPLSDHSPTITCHVYAIRDAIEFAGLGMMLIISLLRYRATVHPLKPAISRRKLKIVCGLVYLVGLIAASGAHLPSCFIKSNDDFAKKFDYAFWVFFVFFLPTIFMAIVYYKIVQALIKQHKHMKRICSNAMRRRAPDSSFILRYIQNRRTFLVCLSVVLCYGISQIPVSVWLVLLILRENHLLMKYVWVQYFARVLKVTGSHSVNPLIYGILDKQLLNFVNITCRKTERTNLIHNL